MKIILLKKITDWYYQPFQGAENVNLQPLRRQLGKPTRIGKFRPSTSWQDRAYQVWCNDRDCFVWFTIPKNMKKTKFFEEYFETVDLKEWLKRTDY